LRLTKHFAFIAVSQLTGCIRNRNPQSSIHFDPHIRSEIVDFSSDIAHQIKTHNLEDPFAVAPGANIDIPVVAEFRDGLGNDAGFLPNFANCGGLRFFAGSTRPFGRDKIAWLRFRAVFAEAAFGLSPGASFFSGSLFCGSIRATCQTSAI
jgi:hypothetical protein